MSPTKDAIVFVSSMLLIAAAGTYAMTQVEPPVQPQTTPYYFTHSTSDMSASDEYVKAMCEDEAMTVTLNLVLISPSEFTKEGVTDIVGYLYRNCIRDNGRGA